MLPDITRPDVDVIRNRKLDLSGVRGAGVTARKALVAKALPPTGESYHMSGRRHLCSRAVHDEGHYRELRGAAYRDATTLHRVAYNPWSSRGAEETSLKHYTALASVGLTAGDVPELRHRSDALRRAGFAHFDFGKCDAQMYGAERGRSEKAWEGATPYPGKLTEAQWRMGRANRYGNGRWGGRRRSEGGENAGSGKKPLFELSRPGRGGVPISGGEGTCGDQEPGAEGGGSDGGWSGGGRVEDPSEYRRQEMAFLAGAEVEEDAFSEQPETARGGRARRGECSGSAGSAEDGGGAKPLVFFRRTDPGDPLSPRVLAHDWRESIEWKIGMGYRGWSLLNATDWYV